MTTPKTWNEAYDKGYNDCKKDVEKKFNKLLEELCP
jgi:hypothetical protein